MQGEPFLERVKVSDKEALDGSTNEIRDKHAQTKKEADAERKTKPTYNKAVGVVDGVPELEDTLVIWAGEFGRSPMLQGGKGRDHKPYGFTVWLAGGGLQGGQSIGTTDAIGLRAEENPVSVKDFHAPLLHALGLRNDDLFFEHNGRPERLTGVVGSARVPRSVLA